MTRSAKEFRRIYGPPRWRLWLEERGCLICGTRPIVLAHVQSGGTGRKADWTSTVGLCDPHHREQHRGTKSFEARYRVNLREAAASLVLAFTQEEG